MDLVKKQMAENPVSETLLGNVLRAKIAILAAARDDRDMLLSTLKSIEGGLPKHMCEIILERIAREGDAAYLQSVVDAMGRPVDKQMLTESARYAFRSAYELSLDDDVRLSGKHTKPVTTIQTLETLGGLDWLRGADDGDSLIHEAIKCRNSQEDILPFVFSKPGIDLNIKDRDGATLLMYAVQDHNHVKNFVPYKGVDWRAKDKYGNSALDHFVTRRANQDPNELMANERRKEESEIMIQNGARLSKKNADKLTDPEIKKWYEEQVEAAEKKTKLESTNTSRNAQRGSLRTMMAQLPESGDQPVATAAPRISLNRQKPRSLGFSNAV